MKTSTDGLVIWEIKTGEADRVITILTNNGIVTAYARNSLLPKNKLTSPTALFSYSNFELFSGKNMYTVDDAVTINRFIKLQTDISRYALAAYFCELMKQLAPIEDDAGEFLSLMRNVLFAINEGKKKLELIKSAFELRLMSLAGYMPDLVMCGVCGKASDANLYFDFTGGRWICESCARERGIGLNCTGSVLQAMRHIIYSQPNKILSFDLGNKSANLLSELTSRFVISHIEKKLTTLDFLNTMMDT